MTDGNLKFFKWTVLSFFTDILNFIHTIMFAITCHYKLNLITTGRYISGYQEYFCARFSNLHGKIGHYHYQFIADTFVLISFFGFFNVWDIIQQMGCTFHRKMCVAMLKHPLLHSYLNGLKCQGQWLVNMPLFHSWGNRKANVLPV